jgi:hypothetical protein
MSRPPAEGDAGLVQVLAAGSQLDQDALASFVSYPLAKKAATVYFSTKATQPLHQASQAWLKAWATKTTQSDFVALHAESDSAQRAAAKTVLVNLFQRVRASNRQRRTSAAASAKAELLEDIERRSGMLDESELIELAADIAARHPTLAERRPYLRSFLQWEANCASLLRDLPGSSPRIVDAAERSRAVQAQIATEAAYAIWEEEYFASDQAALALGAKASNRQRVSALRKSSALLGVPHGNRYLYPRFQFDLGKQALFEEVAEVNTLLDAANDPWGVASWWLSSNGRLGMRPIDAVNTASSADGSLVAAARSLTEPVG